MITIRKSTFIFEEALPDKSIWMWTGYLWEDIKGCNTLNYVDVLVDGPFVEAQKNLCLAYCGSENQRVIDVKKSLEAGEIFLVPEEPIMRCLGGAE